MYCNQIIKDKKMENFKVTKTVEVETFVSLKDIAKQLSCDWNTEQACFINTFASKLNEACGGDIDIQVCDIASELDENGVNFIKKLMAFIK